MKIAVITYHNSYNYGAALQAYATVEYLKSLGCDPYLIDYYPENLRDFGTFRAAYKETGYKTKNRMKRLLLTAVRLPSHKKLAQVFNTFAYTALPLSKLYLSKEELRKEPPEADIYCTGSDQVWNNYYTHEFDDTFFLGFAPAGKPRFALASSFGRSDFTEEELDYIKEHIKGYGFITVREESAKDLLAKMGRDVSVVPDPTLLTDPEIWEDFAKEPGIEGPYILVYQLHGDGTALKKAMKYGKEKNIPVIRINTFLHHFRFGCRNILLPDPHVFLGLFRDADCVFTDSFHGTVFSLLFRKKLAVELPHRFSSRITTLLKAAGAECFILGEVEDWEKTADEADYEKITQNIRKYRDTSLGILREKLTALTAGRKAGRTQGGEQN